MLGHYNLSLLLVADVAFEGMKVKSRMNTQDMNNTNNNQTKEKKKKKEEEEVSKRDNLFEPAKQKGDPCSRQLV